MWPVENLIDTRSRLLTYVDHPCFSMIEPRLEYILGYLPQNISPPDIARLHILDLGCGSTSVIEDDSMRMYEAWFPRVCAYNGAKVTGVDLFSQDPNDKGIYTHIQADLNKLLTDNNLVKRVKGCLFDIIHTRAVFNNRFPGRHYAESIGLDFSGHMDGNQELQTAVTAHINSLIRQAPSLLKVNGLLAINDQFFVMNANRQLVQMK